MFEDREARSRMPTKQIFLVQYICRRVLQDGNFGGKMNPSVQCVKHDARFVKLLSSFTLLRLLRGRSHHGYLPNEYTGSDGMRIGCREHGSVLGAVAVLCVNILRCDCATSSYLLQHHVTVLACSKDLAVTAIRTHVCQR